MYNLLQSLLNLFLIEHSLANQFYLLLTTNILFTLSSIIKKHIKTYLVIFVAKRGESPS